MDGVSYAVWLHWELEILGGRLSAHGSTPRFLLETQPCSRCFEHETKEEGGYYSLGKAAWKWQGGESLGKQGKPGGMVAG
jgi:hypothetical protein